ncbi:SLATT domain-containing protein [Pseudomonas koreensis]|uniref:SLATT domain-containing protein n=1 Tax=Pseudomonas koreensis TaxID=198620 RepID=UPI00123AB82B|nr:SLATT domain-containing protein [Pseudomonas koreensis]
MSVDLELPVDTEQLLRKWYTRCSTVAVGHYKSAEYYTKMHARLSGSAAVLSAITGTTVFATLQNQPALWLQIMLGFFSILAAVLATFSASMAYQEKAEKHRTAGSKYNSIGREFEQIGLARPITQELIHNVRSRLDALAEEAPHIPRKIHKKIANPDQLSNWSN